MCGERGRVCPSQLISPQSAAPAAVARLQGGFTSRQSCHVGVILFFFEAEEVSGFGGSTVERILIPRQALQMSSVVSVTQCTGCQVGVNFKPVEGRRVEDVRMFHRYEG